MRMDEKFPRALRPGGNSCDYTLKFFTQLSAEGALKATVMVWF